MMCRLLTFPLYYFYLLVAVRFDIAFNNHILCVCQCYQSAHICSVSQVVWILNFFLVEMSLFYYNSINEQYK